MAADDVFEPDECEVALSKDGESVRISFRRDNGTSREAVLPRKWLPGLVAQLLAQIEPGSAVPIDQGSLQIGRTFVVQGYNVRKRPDGGCLLTLFVDLPDQGRIVTIPLELSAPEVSEIVAILNGRPR